MVHTGQLPPAHKPPFPDSEHASILHQQLFICQAALQLPLQSICNLWLSLHTVLSYPLSCPICLYFSANFKGVIPSTVTAAILVTSACSFSPSVSCKAASPEQGLIAQATHACHIPSSLAPHVVSPFLRSC